MNNPKLVIDILKCEQLFISLEGEYFLGETQRCLSGDWNMYLKNNVIYLEDDKEIIIIDDKTEFSPRMWDDSFFIVKEKGAVVSEKYYYRGAIEFSIKNDKIVVFNIVDVDFFISSILDRRFAKNDQIEFLKAMVLLYRSYFVKYVNELNEASFIKEDSTRELLLHVNNLISPSPHQLQFKYKGISIEGNEVLRKAVEDTKGDVLFHNSQIVSLPYTFCCGGIPEAYFMRGAEECKDNLNDLKDDGNNEKIVSMSENEIETWIYHPEESYCKTKHPDILEKMISEDIGDLNELYRWRVVVSMSSLIEVLNEKFNFNVIEVKGLTISERSERGSVKTLSIITEKDIIELSDYDLMYLAALLGLPSLTFIYRINKKDQSEQGDIQFSGAGKGHRAGLCMLGAMKMAEEGELVFDIINHYYSDVYIAKQY